MRIVSAPPSHTHTPRTIHTHRLIDTTKHSVMSGLRPDTFAHLTELKKQIQSIHAIPTSSSGAQPHDDFVIGAVSDRLTEEWAVTSHEELELKKVSSDESVSVNTVSGNGECDNDEFDDLRYGVPDHAVEERRHPLSPDQLRAFETAVEKLRSPSDQLLMFIHGPPGTGKTLLANRIMSAASRLQIHSKFAALCGAAAKLNNGTTIHYLAHMGIAEKNADKVSEDQVKCMLEKAGQTMYRLLIIDEASMLTAKILNKIERRYSAANLLDVHDMGSDCLFGGMHIIIMGDMLQLPPPTNYQRSLHYDSVAQAKGAKRYDDDIDLQRGLKTFLTFDKIELTTQNRAKNDPDHAFRVHRLRTHSRPIDDKLLQSLKPLTSAEAVTKEWRYAPVLVTSNLERHVINKHQVVRYARDHGVLVFSWINPITNAGDLEIDETEEEAISVTARRYFAVGAPCYVDQNLNAAATGIVNGSKGKMHSLTFKTGYTIDIPFNSESGDIINVDPPVSVNVRLLKPKHESTKVKNAGPFHNYGDVIPLMKHSVEEKVAGTKLVRKTHPVSLGFSITFHKVQGQTLDRVVLALHKRSPNQLLSLKFEMLYVALTRVRQGDHIRVLYFVSKPKYSEIRPHGGSLDFLKNLSRPKEFNEWMSSYDEGRWCDDILKQKTEKEREKLRCRLRLLKPLTKYKVTELRDFCSVFGLRVEKNPRKHDFVVALYPTWAGLSKARRIPDRYKCIKRKTSTASPHKQRRSSSGNQSPVNRKNIMSNSITLNDHNGDDNCLIISSVPHLSRSTLMAATQAQSDLHRMRSQHTSVVVAKTCMERVKYCQELDYVGQCSRWSAYQLSTPGLFLCDTVVFYFCSHFCKGHESKAWCVDPLYPLEHGSAIHHMTNSENILYRIHELKQTVLFPHNIPHGVHWVIVLVWLDHRGFLHIQCRNSLRGFVRHDITSVSRVETFLRSLYQVDEDYNLPRIKHDCSPYLTQQQLNECGLHVIANAYLASTGQVHTHRFDNTFITQMRKLCLSVWYQHRVRRNITLIMSEQPDIIDLSKDHVRVIHPKI